MHELDTNYVVLRRARRSLLERFKKGKRNIFMIADLTPYQDERLYHRFQVIYLIA